MAHATLVRSQHASTSDDSAAFPTCGLGVLNRRVSEKETVCREGAVDTVVVPEDMSKEVVRVDGRSYR
jgi:hypothetical protein